eukprot:TRINITY_DN2040_c0_g2_i6.p1 TRINITY_DN2040_c0_g2~~TRINITY_DN2040_c0_g2_i6.p1  ORF type:complete len:804 (-),score=171.97 TRINITY_DN2040_c0_g2_i6:144-2555(-)
MISAGPNDFQIGGTRIWRNDFPLTNKSGLTLEVSLYEHANDKEPRPCLLYLHGNAGCRLDAYPIAMKLLPLGISVCCFDFSGCGRSGGDYVTLGWKERDDVDVVVNYLLSIGRVSFIGVWGRSMGAATALLFSEMSPFVSVVVADSPFASLKHLAIDYTVDRYPVPKFLAKGVLSLIRDGIEAKTGADIYEINPVDSAPNIRIPGLFGVAHGDKLTKPDQVYKIFERFAGAPKDIKYFSGNHNTDRTEEFFGPAINFVCEFISRGRPLIQSVPKWNSHFHSSPLMPTPQQMHHFPVGHQQFTAPFLFSTPPPQAQPKQQPKPQQQQPQQSQQQQQQQQQQPQQVQSQQQSQPQQQPQAQPHQQSQQQKQPQPQPIQQKAQPQNSRRQVGKSMPHNQTSFQKKVEKPRFVQQENPSRTRKKQTIVSPLQQISFDAALGHRRWSDIIREDALGKQLSGNKTAKSNFNQTLKPSVPLLNLKVNEPQVVPQTTKEAEPVKVRKESPRHDLIQKLQMQTLGINAATRTSFEQNFVLKPRGEVVLRENLSARLLTQASQPIVNNSTHNVKKTTKIEESKASDSTSLINVSSSFKDPPKEESKVKEPRFSTLALPQQAPDMPDKKILPTKRPWNFINVDKTEKVERIEKVEKENLRQNLKMSTESLSELIKLPDSGRDNISVPARRLCRPRKPAGESITYTRCDINPKPHSVLRSYDTNTFRIDRHYANPSNICARSINIDLNDFGSQTNYSLNMNQSKRSRRDKENIDTEIPVRSTIKKGDRTELLELSYIHEVMCDSERARLNDFGSD